MLMPIRSGNTSSPAMNTVTGARDTPPADTYTAVVLDLLASVQATGSSCSPPQLPQSQLNESFQHLGTPWSPFLPALYQNSVSQTGATPSGSATPTRNEQTEPSDRQYRNPFSGNPGRRIQLSTLYTTVACPTQQLQYLGHHSPLLAGIAPATDDFSSSSTFIAGTAACTSDQASPRVLECNAERLEKATPSRKRARQYKATAENQPASSVPVEAKNSNAAQPHKKKTRNSRAPAIPPELQHCFAICTTEQPAAGMTSVSTSLQVSPSSGTMDISEPETAATSENTDAALPEIAPSGPVWHSAAPGVDLSGAPVLTGPDDPDSDVLPADNQAKFPSQGETLKLCMLPWQVGTVLLWHEVPPVQQLRAIRRFRLRYPTTSWALAEAHVTEKCSKQKSEKQRQEQRTAARKAARDARTAGSNIAVVASRSTGAGSDASVSAPVTPAESVTTNTIVNSVVTPERCIAHGPLFTDDTTALPSASSTPVPAPVVSTAVDAATPEALALDFATQLYHIGVGDEEHPDFLHSDEDQDDMDEFWSELFRSGEFPNNLREWQAEDLFFRTPTLQDPIVNRVEEMNARDMQATGNLGLSVGELDVVSARELLGSDEIVTMVEHEEVLELLSNVDDSPKATLNVIDTCILSRITACLSLFSIEYLIVCEIALVPTSKPPMYNFTSVIV
ncbi:hypothetical protein BZA77DRAFT_343272 [Pyronema omphalodes]|nr:hypothetical protein BZA77DRAFT_343272 [Pyronema omphalodes]